MSALEFEQKIRINWGSGRKRRWGKNFTMHYRVDIMSIHGSNLNT